MKSLKSTLEYLLLPIIFLLKLNKQTNLLALFAVLFMLSGTQSFALIAGGGTNDAPVAEDDSVTTDINQSILIDVMANDSDPDGDEISITEITTVPSHGNATIEDGKILYTPESGYEGADSFEYEIKDDVSYDSKTDTATVTIAIQEGNNPLFENEYSCGVFGSVLISYEQIQMGQNEVYNACEISVKDLNFDEDTNGVDVTCYSDTGDTKCSCTETDDSNCSNDGTCTIVPEPDNTYDHTFIETTVTTSTTTSENIEFTELEYGSYRFDGNNGDNQEIYFNPQETYLDNDTKVMLLGDFSFAGNGQSLTFEGGDYYFESFKIDSDENSNINQINLCAKENIRIFVHEDFVYSGNHLNDEGCGGKIFVYVEGDADVDSNGGGDSDIPLFLYVEGDVNIQPSGDSNGWLGAITAEGAINITKGNSTSNFNFTYDDSAEEFGMGECQMCYTDILVGGMSMSFMSCPGATMSIGTQIIVPIEATDPLTDVTVDEVHDSEFTMAIGTVQEVETQDGDYVRDADSDANTMGPVSGGTGVITTTYTLGDDDGNYGATEDDDYQQLASSSMFEMSICDYTEELEYIAHYDDGDKHYDTVLSQCDSEESEAYSYNGGTFDAWDTFRDNDDTPPEDRNISTKIAFKPFKLSLASLNKENNEYETKPGDSNSISVAIYENGDKNLLISNSIDFDANATGHISESSDLIVEKSVKNASVGFKFCATLDGSLYTLYNSQNCSGDVVDCNQTTEGRNPEWHICFSSDNLAIRPEKYEIVNPTFEDDEALDLLRSGKDYNFTINALTEDAEDTEESETGKGYDQNSSELTILTEILNNENQIDESLEGTATFAELSEFYFVDGNSTNNEEEHDVAGLTFDNVGNLHITIVDKNWAAVDNDDTNQSCESTTINDEEVPGTWICADKNATFIPDHFELEEVIVSNRQADQDFTYLSNDLNMAAHLGLMIKAMNAKGGITTNFKENDTIYYENPVEVNLTIPTEVTYYDSSTETMTPIKEEIASSLLGFGGEDDNGTHRVNASENKLLFNYQRDNNTPKNPFNIEGTEVNVSISSEYVSNIESEKKATIRGNNIASETVTFQYARVKSTKSLYVSATDTANTPIKIEVYCDAWPASSTNCPNVDVINGTTNDYKWFISTDHHQNQNDGNVTLKIDNGEASLSSTTVDINSNGINSSIDVNANANTTRPMIVDISLDESDSTNMSSWLIYNPTKAYQVKFVGTMDWAGHGDTGKTIDSSSSSQRTQRLGW